MMMSQNDAYTPIDAHQPSTRKRIAGVATLCAVALLGYLSFSNATPDAAQKVQAPFASLATFGGSGRAGSGNIGGIIGGRAAPADVYSMKIANDGDQPVTARVVYTTDASFGKEDVVASEIIKPGRAYNFKQKTFEMDGWTATYIIGEVSVTGSVSNSLAAPASIKAPFKGVYGPTKGYEVRVNSVNGVLNLKWAE